jgi:serine/threonine protein kinase
VHVDEPSLIGTTLDDRYRLIEVIGDGGMGRVYRAEQLSTGQAVALKLLHAEFVGVDQVVQRFEREAKVTTELSHPHIVKVIEFGEWNGRLFLAMELLAGRSLAELIAERNRKNGRPLTVKRTLAIMRPVFDALEYLHGVGVVHRDLKPENIMVIPGRGLLGRENVKMLDFGIAKLGQHPERPAPQNSNKLTHHGLIIGTPAYMSPEQAAGQEVDVRSDLYSCGVILYQMLTGQRPFEAESNLDVLVMHLNTQPKSMRAVGPGAWIPDAVENVVLRALAKRPAERFQSARELREALERAAVIDYGDAAASPTRPARLPVIRFSIMAAAVALLLGDHMRVRASTASEAVVAGAEAATPAAVAPPASPEIASEPLRRSKHHGKQKRNAAKRASSPRHR